MRIINKSPIGQKGALESAGISFQIVYLNISGSRKKI